MWRSQIPASKNAQKSTQQTDDDWETDPDFVNSVSEKEQRYGSKTVAGSGVVGSQNLADLREAVVNNDAEKKKQIYDQTARPIGYGGTYGVQTDRMDKSAVGSDYKAEVIKHSSQKDYTQGFGGKFGVQSDRQDKSAETFAYKATTEKHSSQQDYTKGFGGKFGVEHDKKDANAEGFDYKSESEKHSSQTEYKQGYGGTHGVQRDRQDKSAVGWDHHEQTEKHSSQKDYSKGFGGKFGVESDKQDKSAAGWEKSEKAPPKPAVPVVVRSSEANAENEQSESAKSIKAKFELMNKSKPEAAAPPPRPAPGRIAASRWQQPKQTDEAETSNETSKEKPATNGIKKNGHASFEEHPAEAVSAKEHVPAVTELSAEHHATQHSNLFAEDEANDADVVVDHQPVADLSHQFAEQAAVTDHEATNTENEATFEQHDFEPHAEPMNQTGAQEPQSPQSNLTAIAQYDYETSAPDELPLATGVLVTNIQMVDEGWWYGTANGQSGLFPANYVELNH